MRYIIAFIFCFTTLFAMHPPQRSNEWVYMTSGGGTDYWCMEDVTTPKAIWVKSYTSGNDVIQYEKHIPCISDNQRATRIVEWWVNQRVTNTVYQVKPANMPKYPRYISCEYSVRAVYAFIERP